MKKKEAKAVLRAFRSHHDYKLQRRGKVIQITGDDAYVVTYYQAKSSSLDTMRLKLLTLRQWNEDTQSYEYTPHELVVEYYGRVTYFLPLVEKFGIYTTVTDGNDPEQEEIKAVLMLILKAEKEG